MALKGKVSVTISATPEAVWEWVGHLERHGEFSPKPYEVTLTSGVADHVGSRYHSVGWVPGDGHHPNDVEVVEVVPLRHLAFRANDPLGAFANQFDLREVAGGTEVTFEMEFPPLKGMNSVMIPFAFRLIGIPALRKRMGLLKAKVEANRSE